ncbi:phosphotransferase [Nakamurella sp. YIM 132087]|uniref:Phosphotransferase n=2 Tax=Nakamurella alba TaxID=2665158 RepID=A0A7K1FQ52_9ACTN|nr:phosphotransferase [Nakamurella alba]
MGSPDPAVIGPALAAAAGDDRWTDVTATLIAGGKSNLTFRLTSPAGSAVLRRPPTGTLLPKAHDMGREVRVQQALAPTPVPVARIPLADDGGLLGVPCYVMELVDGQIIRDTLPDGFADAGSDRAAIAHALVDTLADLHTVDHTAVGLDGFGRAGGYIERQVARWSDQWARSSDHPVPDLDELARRLRADVPPDGGVAVVHGDYRLDNCVLDATDPGTVRAVLDWELATIGDPLADIGALLFFWREMGESFPVLIPGVSNLPGFPTRADLAQRYAERSGLDLSRIAYYEAFAAFRFAVITQGVARRAADGAMAGQQFGDVADDLAMMAAYGLERIPAQSRQGR